MRSIPLHIVIVFFLFDPGLNYGQRDSIQLVPGPIPIEQFLLIRDINDLPDIEIQNIVKDELGFLWMNTNHHLVRYDGNSFLILENQPRSQFRLNGNDLVDLGKDPLGNIVVQYDDQEVLFDLINPSSLEITPIFFDQDLIIDAVVNEHTFPTILTQSPDSLQLLQVKQNQITNFFSAPISGINNPDDLVFGCIQNDELWLYDNGTQLLKLNLLSTQIYPWPQTNNDGGIAFFHVTRQNEVLFGFNDYPGLFQYDSILDSIVVSTWISDQENYGKVWEDQIGNLLFSVKLNFRNLKEYMLITPENKLYRDINLVRQDIQINDLYAEDIFAKPYFSTYKGLYVGVTPNAQFENYLVKNISNNQWGTVCRGIASIDLNQIVVSHEFDSISFINTSDKTVESRRVVLTNPEDSSTFNMSCASSLQYDGQALVWGASCDAYKNAYLYSYDIRRDSVSTFLCFKNSLITDFVLDTAQQNIWMAIRYQGKDGILGMFNLQDSTFIIEKGPIDPIFRGNIPNSIYQDSDSILLLATDKGLVRYDIFNQELSLAFEQLREQKLYSVFRSANRGLIAGGYNGMFFIDPVGDINVFSREKGIKNRVASLVEDGLGNLWIGTSNGLLYFDRDLEIITRYSELDGLPNNEFNTKSLFVADEVIYMGTINGVVGIQKINEGEDLNELTPSILQIRKLHSTKGSLIQESNLDKLKRIVINPQDLTVNISIFNPYFLTQKKETFAYKVEGSDLIWSPIALNEDIQLEKLPPGEYTLRVRMKKDNGLWSQSELNLPIVVRSEFYKSSWFILVSTLIGIGLFGLIMHYYNVRGRRKQQEENEIQQKFAELELHALRSQMNPHFIFNSLNAIQYFIQTNDRKQSDAYISKFAHLIRLFLEASKKKYISLAEEIKVITAYIDLEKLRFRGKLESKIEIEESLDSIDTIIPSMLIQPFVENAINHGIFHKSGLGHVDIVIKQSGEELIECIITDDGIGRKKAAEIKKKSIGKYESRGISLIDDRIHVLQRSLSQNIDYQIEDLEENGSASGTRVVLKLPIIE